ncbi:MULTISPECIES: entericidin [Phyllobacteriaceae]|uniref:entericidin domain-containing protein n=1 Tax=Phyllobacteriaceae TaxID=69277 RepID=UPI002ACAADD4|nr:entericidin [Chelativorans sp. M5D2P16]MDZ5696955.1 entericidin [Chelativorans sp. M5D2P16]
MLATILSRLVVLIAVIGLTAGCANTIRGVGQDTANVVDATQDAGENVAGSANSY